MNTVLLSEAREHLDELCESVVETGEPITIVGTAGQKVRLIAVSRAMERTERITANHEFVRELREAGERVRRGEVMAMSADELVARTNEDRP